MNIGISIHTHYMEESLKGTIKLHIMQIPTKSLEMELLANGYTSMQNKLRRYLIQRYGSPKNIRGLELSEMDAYRIIDEMKALCTERADVDAGSPAGNAITRYISHSFEPTVEKVVCFYPASEQGTSHLMPTAMALVSQELYGTAEYNETQRRHLNTLLTQKARKYDDTRKELIRAAYRLGMNLEQTNTFLTKAALTHALDYQDEWELLAAYLITCQPVSAFDPAIVFQHSMDKAAAQLKKIAEGSHTSENAQLRSFLGYIHRKEYERWVKACQAQSGPKQRADFLMQWAWKLLIAKEPKYGKRSFYSRLSLAAQEEINDRFSAQFARLSALAKHIGQNELLYPKGDEAILAAELVSLMQDRQLQLLELLYGAAGQTNDSHITLRCCENGHLVGTFSPAFKTDGFTKLDRTLQKIADPGRTVYRSDIMSIAIELGLSWEELDRALETGGFCKLYVKDLHEQALAAALEAGPMDTDSRKLAILEQLQLRYQPLSQKLLAQMAADEPEWIRRIRKWQQTS